MSPCVHQTVNFSTLRYGKDTTVCLTGAVQMGKNLDLVCCGLADLMPNLWAVVDINLSPSTSVTLDHLK